MTNGLEGAIQLEDGTGLRGWPLLFGDRSLCCGVMCFGRVRKVSNVECHSVLLLFEHLIFTCLLFTQCDCSNVWCTHERPGAKIHTYRLHVYLDHAV